MNVDVIVPTYNGRELLAECLAALRAQTYRDFAVVVVDDGSTDDTLAWLRANLPKTRVLALGRNAGLAAATNAALRATSAPYVALLNNDAVPEPDWLAALVATIDRHLAAGSVASRMRLYDRRDRLHSAGDTYSIAGMPGNRGVWGTDGPAFDQEVEVWAACAGAALYRRAALDAVAIGGDVLDEALFMYCEDVDLGWRLRLAGYPCIYCPEAIVYHRLSATGGGPLASYWVGRNLGRVLVAAMPAALLRRHWPRIVRRHTRLGWEALTHVREPAARARLRGQFRSLGDLAGALRRRAAVRRLMVATADRLEPLLTDE